MVGGSSGINYMMYVRGSTQDYDDWAELVEDDGWRADIMQQYMRRHQVCTIPTRQSPKACEVSDLIWFRGEFRLSSPTMKP